MALIKSKELSNGVIVSYWVARCIQNVDKDTTAVEAVPYIDKASREAGKSHIAGIIPAGNMEGRYLDGGDVYSHIKALVTSTETDEDGNETQVCFFADAEDDV